MTKRKSKPKQTPRRVTHAGKQKSAKRNPRAFNYDLDYKTLNLRFTPELYRVGVGEQGVLLVEPYKSEILPLWKFKTPDVAKKSAQSIFKAFKNYRDQRDFVGMDMARKFLQMGYTRSRRYANHSSGRKYDKEGNVLPNTPDEVKAASAKIFYEAWKKAEADSVYAVLKAQWKAERG